MSNLADQLLKLGLDNNWEMDVIQDPNDPTVSHIVRNSIVTGRIVGNDVEMFTAAQRFPVPTSWITGNGEAR